nr:MAG TPA: Putative tail length tape measure protein [Caudoviricetes sp.]
MGKNIKFNVTLTVDGKEQLVAATANVNDLKKAVNGASNSAKKLRTDVINLNQAAEVFSNVANSVNNLRDFMSKLSESYNRVQQANTELTTVMRQRMDATDEDVKKVNEVISAQSKLGVVGGVAQRIGAQQVATFLRHKETLTALIPAMNNLIAQQRGVNATEEDARSVANLMGKAMMGQTSALRKVGITFSDAQEKILRYGDEQQRAAMLAQVITDNVGNMNAELGKTSAGKLQHVEQRFNAIKIKLGEVVTSLLPFVTFGAQAVMIAANVGRLVAGVRGLVAVMGLAKLKTIALSAAMGVWKIAGTAAAWVTRGLQSAFNSAAVSATGFRIALQSVLVTTGVGAVLVALGMAINYFINKCEESGGAVSKLAYQQSILKQSAQRTKEVYDQTNGETFAELMGSFSKLQAAWKSLAATQKPAWIIKNREELKKLGLNINTVGDAENVFVKNTNAVVDAFKKRAQAAARLAMLTEEYKLQMELSDKINQKNNEATERNKKRAGSSVTDFMSEREISVGKSRGDIMFNPNGVGYIYTQQGADRYNASHKWYANGAETKAQKAALAASKARSNRLEKQAVVDAKSNFSVTPHVPDKTKKKKDKKALQGSIDWYEKKLQELQSKIKATPNTGLAQGLQKEYEATEAKLKDLKIKIGLEKPEKKEAVSYMDSLKKQLAEAQKDFDNAIDVPAKVKASAKVQELQQQINDATKGKLTIPAAQESSYVAQGSADDKRQSYSNAQQKVERLKSDVEIGLIGAPEAMAQLDAINKLVEKLGLKPIKLEIDTTEADKAKAKMQAATDAVGQMGSSISGLGDAIGVPELNPVGTMMQAIATMVAGFATATAQAASMGPWGWIAFAALGLAQLTAMITSVKSSAGSFATGGVIGGNSYAGDRLTAHVNSGEMILNKQQQARLFNIANGLVRPVMIAPQVIRPTIGSMPSNTRVDKQTIELSLSGRALRGVLNNEERISRRKPTSVFG